MQVFRSRSVNLCRLATSRCFSLSTGPATGPLSGARLSSVFQGVVSELNLSCSDSKEYGTDGLWRNTNFGPVPHPGRPTASSVVQLPAGATQS